MRTQTLSNIVSIEYNDELVFSGNRNTLTVTSLNAKPVGANITFTNTSLEHSTVEYSSLSSSLVFRISDSIRKLYRGANTVITVSGYVTNNGIAYPFNDFTFKVNEGMTLLERPNGCVRTLYYVTEDDLEKLEVFVPTGGTARIGGSTYSLSKGVNKLDVSSDVSVGESVKMHVTLHYSHSDTPVLFGDVFRHNSPVFQDNTEYDIAIRRADFGGSEGSGPDCATGGSTANSFGEIAFRNTDGCDVYFGGIVTKIKNGSDRTEYLRNDLTVNTPRSFVASKSSIMTLVVNADYNSYLSDIAYSNDIRFLNGYGEWMPAILESNDLTFNGKNEDIELNLKILN